jgi:hypothetical protein
MGQGVLWCCSAMAPLIELSFEQATRVIGKKALKGDALVMQGKILLNPHMFDLHCLVFILEFFVDEST